MQRLPELARRVTGFALENPSVAWALTSFHAVLGVGLALTDHTLNNEGLLTHYWASWATTDFIPVVFFQKVKPVLCVLYAPFSLGGAHATLVAHALVASTAIPLLAATARALGQRLPNLCAVAVALSPLYLVSGASGVSNTDGVVGIALALYLLCAVKRPFWAGVVIGLLPWVRFELVLFAGVMATFATATPAIRRMLLGMAVFPAVYALTGAVYHGDALWILHFPPAAPFDAGNPIFLDQLIGLEYILEPAAAVTPIAALAIALPLARLERTERALAAYAVLTVIVMNLFPILHLGNFGTAPRYLLPLLPPLALLIGRAAEPWWEGERLRPVTALAVASLAIWIATRQTQPLAVAVLIGAVALVALAALCRLGTEALALALGLVLVGPMLPIRTEIIRSADASYLDSMAGWLAARRERTDRPIYTNGQLLAPFLEHRLPRARIVHVAGEDIVREVVLLTNEANGQRARITRLCRENLYGRTVFAPLDLDAVPVGTLFALREDARLDKLFPAEAWSDRFEVITQRRDYRIVRLVTVAGP